MLDFLHTKDCRMQFLLVYFGELAPSKCEHCDRCNIPFERKSVAIQAHILALIQDRPRKVAELILALPDEPESIKDALRNGILRNLWTRTETGIYCPCA